MPTWVIDLKNEDASGVWTNNQSKPLFGVAKYSAGFSDQMTGGHDTRGRMLRVGRQTDAQYAYWNYMRFFVQVPDDNADDPMVDKYLMLDMFALDQDGQPIAQHFRFELTEYFLRDGHSFTSAEDLVDFRQVTNDYVANPKHRFRLNRGVGNETAGKPFMLQIRIKDDTDFRDDSLDTQTPYAEPPYMVGIRGAAFSYGGVHPELPQADICDIADVMQVSNWLAEDRG